MRRVAGCLLCRGHLVGLEVNGAVAISVEDGEEAIDVVGVTEFAHGFLESRKVHAVLTRMERKTGPKNPRQTINAE